jgi:hypothetical protein
MNTASTDAIRLSPAAPARPGPMEGRRDKVPELAR